MSEIREYRGQMIDKKKWVYGYLWASPVGIYILQSGWEISVMLDSIAVNPNTVGQYTGLTDKNGTRIFEGDIVKHGYLNKYCQERLTAKYIVKWGKCGFGTALACITEQEICEVIGNIHEEVAE